MLLPRAINEWVRQEIKRRGYVFMRRTNPYYFLGRRLQLMRSYGIELVVDVGANSGQYALRLRELGYSGRIASFEPMAAVFAELSGHASRDDRWEAHAFGLGDAQSTAELHVSANSVSSSLLGMLAAHGEHAPRSRFVGTENVQIRRLDEIYPRLGAPSGRTWMKIDVQGFEDRVLDGAAGCLQEIRAIQIELSLRPLYEGQLTIIPMMERLAALGFDPVAFEPGFEDKQTGEYLQVDGIFRNRRFAGAAAELR